MNPAHQGFEKNLDRWKSLQPVQHLRALFALAVTGQTSQQYRPPNIRILNQFVEFDLPRHIRRSDNEENFAIQVLVRYLLW
jgi:hypothetical protein